METATQLVLGLCREGLGGYICCVPVHPISLAINDIEYRELLNRALLATPDGMPVVWVGQLRFGRSVGRVYGPDLMQSICDSGRGEGIRHFFYGGAEGVGQKLANKLKNDYPGLEICGIETPPYSILDESELSALADRIRRSGAQVLWVGLGVPKQERLMARLEAHLPEQIQIGVGAAFDFLSGTKAQAPQWMQRIGLEWLFRLCCEPRRLMGRYLIGNTRFLYHLFLQATGLRKYPMVGIESENP